jgi:hypothetical protein
MPFGKYRYGASMNGCSNGMEVLGRITVYLLQEICALWILFSYRI